MAFLQSYKQPRTGNGVVKFGTLQGGDKRNVLALDNCAMNGAEATRTVEFQTEGLDEIRVAVVYTYSAGTSVTITPYHSDDGGTTYTQPTAVSISGGTGTLSKYAESLTTSAANQSFSTTFNVDGANAMKLIFACGGTPGAGDLIDVYVTGYKTH